MKKICLLLIAAVGLAGCSQEYMAEREFYKAQKVLESIKLTEGDKALDKAIDAFSQIVEKYPSSRKALESLNLIANMRIRQKQFDKAREALKTVIQNFSSGQEEVVDARYRMARIYEQEGNWDAAEKMYWDLIQYHPMHRRGLYTPIHLLNRYKRIKDEKAFQATYVRVLDHFESLMKQIGPIESLATVKNYLGTVYMLNDEWRRAIDEWRSIVEQFPQSPFAPLALLSAGELAWKRQNYGDAEKYYYEFFDKYATHRLAGQTAVRVGLQYYMKKEFAQARKWFTKAVDEYFTVQSKQRQDVLLLIGMSFQYEGKWQNADEIYTQIENEYGLSSAGMQIPLLRADYYRSVGENEQATDTLNKAILQYEILEGRGDQTPDTVGMARRMRASALMAKGDWDTLITDLDKYKLEENDPQREGRWLFLKALLTETRLKDKNKALDLYQDFIDQYPNHPLVSRALEQIEGINTGKSQAESPDAEKPVAQEAVQAAVASTGVTES